MSGFEVITITFSFVLGLGVAQILMGASLAIRRRDEQRLHGAPMSYRVDGRQYIGIAGGGRAEDGELIVFALP